MFRYRLGTLFLLVTVTSVWLAMWSSSFVGGLASSAICGYGTITLAILIGNESKQQLAISISILLYRIACVLIVFLYLVSAACLLSGKFADIGRSEAWCFAGKYLLVGFVTLFFLLGLEWVIRSKGSRQQMRHYVSWPVVILFGTQIGLGVWVIYYAIYRNPYRHALQGSFFTFSEEVMFSLVLGNVVAIIAVISRQSKRSLG